MDVERYKAIVVQNASFKKINTSFLWSYRKHTNHIMAASQRKPQAYWYSGVSLSITIIIIISMKNLRLGRGLTPLN